MAIRTKEELLNSLKGILTDDMSDEGLALLEDFSDTLTSLSTKDDSEDWKKKYEENDKEWRQKYRDRFFNTGSEDSGGSPKELEPEEEKPQPKNYEDLFTVKEG